MARSPAPGPPPLVLPPQGHLGGAHPFRSAGQPHHRDLLGHQAAAARSRLPVLGPHLRGPVSSSRQARDGVPPSRMKARHDGAVAACAACDNFGAPRRGRGVRRRVARQPHTPACHQRGDGRTGPRHTARPPAPASSPRSDGIRASASGHPASSGRRLRPGNSPTAPSPTQEALPRPLGRASRRPRAPPDRLKHPRTTKLPVREP